jgi:DNA modification methylase
MVDKQRGYGRRHAGFNDRWDAMPKPVQQMGGANKRSVWTVATHPYAGAHFATFPEKLIEPCILAGAPFGGLVLDPFVGSGTTVAVAQRLGRRGVGVDLSYQQLALKRTAQQGIPFTVDAAS